MPLLICPNCNVGMTQVTRSGIEIDMCPQCRSVWLDRGELEKLLQPLRSESISDAPQSQDNRYDTRPPHDGYRHDSRHNDRHERDDPRWRKRKRGFDLLDIFD